MFLSESSCKVCSSEVKDVCTAVLCNLCENWINTDCASIGETRYEDLKEKALPWYYSYCIMERLFSTIKNKDLQILLNGSSHNNYPNQFKKMNKKTKEVLNIFHELSQIFEQSENPLGCDYYDTSEFKKLKITKQQ